MANPSNEDRLTASLGPDLPRVEAALAEMGRQKAISRLWAHDFTLWKPDPAEISNRLGWLQIIEPMRERQHRSSVDGSCAGKCTGCGLETLPSRSGFGQVRDGGVRQPDQVVRRDWEDAIGGPRGRPDLVVGEQVAVHEGPNHRWMPERRGAADREPGRGPSLLRGRSSHRCRTAQRREPFGVYPVRTGRERQHRVVVGHEDQGLHDLDDVAADRPRGVVGGPGPFGEPSHPGLGIGLLDLSDGRLRMVKSNADWSMENPRLAPNGRFIEATKDRTMEELFRTASEKYHMLFGIVQRPEDLVRCPHLEAREFFQDVDHPVIGRIKVPFRLWSMSDGGARYRCPAPLHGQHNEEVYRERLGLDAKAIAALAAQGVN